ncbi:MAG: MFS transporter, partial [Armatimonadota bacterium]|nr:MFS transporter [Armatimonadota bacterium]
ALWGMGVGLQESVLRAAVARMVAQERRASAFGLFQTVYGVAWFAGSGLMGFLYDVHPRYLVLFAVGAQLSAAVLFGWSAARSPLRPR